MKKTILSILMAIVASVSVGHAENYPYRSDALWVTVPDHADWLYKTGEKATIDVQFYKYGIPRDGEIEWSVGTDLLESDLNGKAKLINGHCKIVMGTAKKPCFRDLRLKLKLDGATYQHHVKVGFSVDNITPYTAMPRDFNIFWEQAVSEVKAFPLQFTKERIPEYCNSKVETWLVKLKTDQRHSLYGYLMLPAGAKAKSCPVVLTPPGAGVKTIKEFFNRSYFQENGIIRFITEIHGLDPRLPEETFNDIRSAFSEYLEMGLENPQNYYMLHVYQGLVKCIDLLCSLPEWDGKNVAVLGGSQGGALSLIAAALDNRITLCVANHPALSDMAAGAADLTSGYPHFKKERGFYSKECVNTLSYFDVVNFAPAIKCLTYMTWGYNDNTCPPTTSYAVWNRLNCPKESLITPINEHWTSDTTNRQQMEWLLKHFK